ncbi:hypothetical protein RB2654_08492 [Rhodobacterales bacterium HTCC2654]|uniref:Uncharacterized protein n=1 Tax=Maritimibacter alkaliphilus HTCC2654 TaxID=314271 RepID=A3VHN9_9RHOB|nr:hypothetical protein RB2654_08492 [Rhodobacterales bacterium HTCC2654] [Maritimibacter alkaliphilus HTCC2654]
MQEPGGAGHAAHVGHGDEGAQRGEVEVSGHITILDGYRQNHSLP